MAALSQAERDRISRWIQRDPNFGVGGVTFLKADLIAAAAAADAWADSVAAAYNLALPLPFRTSASAAQKALLLMYVIARRTGAVPIDGGD